MARVDVMALRMGEKAVVTRSWRQPIPISRNYIAQVVLVSFRVDTP